MNEQIHNNRSCCKKVFPSNVAEALATGKTYCYYY